MLVLVYCFDEVEKIVVVVCVQVVVGDLCDLSMMMGLMVNKCQYWKVQEMIQVGIDEGVLFLLGGFGSFFGFERGYYVKLIVFSCVNNQMMIVMEEIFGLVLVIIFYWDEFDVVVIVNDLLYGLLGYVYGELIEQVEWVVRKLWIGMVYLNGVVVDIVVLFGGYKQLGNGCEWGYVGIEEFFEMKFMFGVILGVVS